MRCAATFNLNADPSCPQTLMAVKMLLKTRMTTTTVSLTPQTIAKQATWVGHPHSAPITIQMVAKTAMKTTMMTTIMSRILKMIAPLEI